MNTLCRVLAAACVFGFAVGLVGGCGKELRRAHRVPVSGMVLRLGQPVAEATVLFEPLGNTPAATGTTDATGRFRLTTYDTDDGAAPGEYKVAVRKVQVIPSNRPGDAPDDLATPPPDEKWLLPMKYGHGASSGLTATVKADAKNEFKFELPD